MISTHTPARGVTVYIIKSKICILDFNPHSRKGSDKFLPGGLQTVLYFNPHSRKGSDFELIKTVVDNYIFQPTLPQGE